MCYGRRASRATSWASSRSSPSNGERARRSWPEGSSLERRLIDDDDGAAPASHYNPLTRLIATSAGATTVAPPGCAARERGRPALCANSLDEFVRALLLRSTSRRAGRPVGSTPLRVRTAFFKAVMFPLHCYPHIVLLPRVSFPLLPPALIRSSQSTRGTRTRTGVRKSVDPARTRGN